MTEQSPSKSLRAASFMGAGFAFIAELSALAYLGHLLDSKFAWAPWGLLGGTLLGLAVATLTLMWQAETWERAKRERKP